MTCYDFEPRVRDYASALQAYCSTAMTPFRGKKNAVPGAPCPFTHPRSRKYTVRLGAGKEVIFRVGTVDMVVYEADGSVILRASVQYSASCILQHITPFGVVPNFASELGPVIFLGPSTPGSRVSYWDGDGGQTLRGYQMPGNGQPMQIEIVEGVWRPRRGHLVVPFTHYRIPRNCPELHAVLRQHNYKNYQVWSMVRSALARDGSPVDLIFSLRTDDELLALLDQGLDGFEELYLYGEFVAASDSGFTKRLRHIIYRKHGLIEKIPVPFLHSYHHARQVYASHKKWGAG